MARAGGYLAGILAELEGRVESGVTGLDLEHLARSLIKDAGALPAFLGYKPQGAKRGFPAALCFSVNEIVVHGVPTKYVIRDGDIVKLDLGLILGGYYVDSAITVGVGAISDVGSRLIDTTKKALSAGIEQLWPGKTLGDIGCAIETVVREKNFAVVEGLTGHGIGKALHENPYVHNRGKRGDGEALAAGMVLAIEPMVSAGDGKIKTARDDSFVTADGALSAHFEHTVAITDSGPRVLTERTR